jgi:hypothetical protein
MAAQQTTTGSNPATSPQQPSPGTNETSEFVIPNSPMSSAYGIPSPYFEYFIAIIAGALFLGFVAGFITGRKWK